MAELGPITIKCPGCGEQLPVPSTVVADLPHTPTVLVRMDSTQAREHFRECAKRATAPAANVPAVTQPQTPQGELAGRVHRMLDMRAYITPGKRACTMCGTEQAKCLSVLGQTHVGCCPSCTAGDTHPVPGHDMTCAEWGAQQAGGDRG